MLKETLVSHNMYVKHNFKVFQCLCTLLKDLYIDYTFNDETITK